LRFSFFFFSFFFVWNYFRVSKSSDSSEEARDYVRAEQSGRDRGECWQYYSKCPKSIFNQQHDNNLYMWSVVTQIFTGLHLAVLCIPFKHTAFKYMSRHVRTSSRSSVIHAL
jgi:hypothetical protein